MQNKKQGFLSKISSFAEEKGFYIILAVCLIAIGISGYVLFFTGDEPQDNPDNISVANPDDDIVTPPQIKEPIITTDDEPDDEPDEPVAVVTPDEPSGSEQDAQTTLNPIKVAKIEYYLPLGSEVTREFSGETLVFDDTMSDWRTHNGTDFAAALGDEVRAIANGKVTGVFNDGMKGNCVTLTHSDGIVSTYCGLADNTTLKVGMEVRGGQAIAKAGNTMLAESGQDDHVHIEVTQNGKYINLMKLKFK